MAKPVRPEPKFFLDAAHIGNGRIGYEQKYFAGVREDQVIGEKGTSYIEYPEAAERILKFYPTAKAIAILRHPVQRAISNYHFSVENGLETRTMREVFLEKRPHPSLRNTSSVSPFDYLGRGDYLKHLKPWAKKFDENLRIVIFEEIKNAGSSLQDLYNWIGVDRDFIPINYQAVVNSSDVKNMSIIDPEVIAELKEHFSPCVEALESWLGKQVPQWHDPI